MELDESTKKALKAIPLMRTKAGPRDGDAWLQVLHHFFEVLFNGESMFCL